MELLRVRDCHILLVKKLTIPPLVNPAKDSQVRGDAFKTLFIARLSYDTRESDLEREFGRFGPIERVNGLIVILDIKTNRLVDSNCYKHS